MAIRFMKAILFLSFAALLFFCVQRTMTVPGDDRRNYQWVRGFYAEPKNSLDIVFIGGSNIYAFLEPPLIFARYGITSWSFATNSQPPEIALYLLKEARKRQPDALYVINISGTSETFSEPQMHYILDYMPLSQNKLALTRYMLDFSEYETERRIEFYIPLVRYHSRWKSLKQADFVQEFDGFKSGSTYNAFLKNAKDVSDNFMQGAEVSPLSKKVEDACVSLLDYCEENNVNVLFVMSPQALKANKGKLEKLNSLKNLIVRRGYPVLDLVERFDDTNLDLTTDFYNEHHTNIHGALKVQDVVVHYAKDLCDFKDKRSNEQYTSWNKSAINYLGFVEKYLTDDERNEYRDIPCN